jgi:simple sugar transport system ATP-binding protein
MTELFLSMKNISKHFAGVQALNAVDFELRRGEIHCLAGENGSGKSTLVKIIAGVLKPDAGALIEVDGVAVHHASSIAAIHQGIAVIYQDPSLFPTLSVAENIAFSTMIAEGRHFIDPKMIRKSAEIAVARIGVDLPLDTRAGELSMADQQLVAICRALTGDVRLLIMDEPTTALTRKEVDSLFAVVKDLEAKGIGTLFISHKLDEVFEISERVTVLRDGNKIGTYSSGELDETKLSFLMTGQTLEFPEVQAVPESSPVLLEVRNLSKHENYRDISLTLRAGEILGLTGLLGSGRTELALSIFGLNKPDSGSILVDGKQASIRSVRDAMKLGIAYVPENRLSHGLVMGQSVGKNIVVTIVRRMLSALGFIDVARYQDAMRRWVADLSIKVPTPDSLVETLSGGNQQRVVLAKWMATAPKILILDGPTVGIDVAAKSGMHTLIRALASRGVGIIIISDEVSEVYHNSNRVLVMKKGRLIGEFNAAAHSLRDIAMALS